MPTYLIRYLILTVLLIIGFSSTISCGAELYQVDLTDDLLHDQKSMKNIPTKDHHPQRWQNLPITLRMMEGLSPIQSLGLMTAAKVWEDAIGLNLFEFVVEEELPAEKGLAFHLKDQQNSLHFEKVWTSTGKSSRILATTIWDNKPDSPVISTGDILFNSEYFVFTDAYNYDHKPDKEIADLISVSIHELGHLLGLSHIDKSTDPYSVMNTKVFIGYGFAARDLSPGDIERIQNLYR